jgi:integrase
LDPVRVIFRHAIKRGIVAVNPCDGLELEKAAERDLEVPDLADVAAMLDALPVDKRALWSTAAFAGLRHGELRALRCSDVDLKERRIRVRRGWDDEEGEQEPKTKNAKRDVMILADLGPLLSTHMMRTGRRGDDLIFGATATEPFPSTSERRAAQKAWKQENARGRNAGGRRCRCSASMTSGTRSPRC